MPIVNGYCTLPELKARMQLEDTLDDELINDCINSASRTIDNYCDRQFYATTEARYFDPPCGELLTFGPFNDLTSVTSVKSDATGDGTFETTWAASEYQLVPVNRAGPEARPYTGIRSLGRSWPYAQPSVSSRLIEITGTWGWSAVPSNVKTACLIQAQREVKQRYMPSDTTYLPWTVVASLIDRYRLRPAPVA